MSDPQQQQQPAAPASPAASAAQPPQTPQQQQTRMWNGRLERCKHCSPVYASLLDYRHANRFTDITVLLPKGHPPLQTIADSLGNFEDIVKARDDGRVAVRAHKLVLAIASGTLSHFFENVMDEAAEGDVVELDLDKVLPADPQHVAGAVLDWMYARQVHVHAGNVLGMLRAAEDLDVQDLLQLAKTILARFLAVDPALVLPSAVQFARHDLVDTIVRALLQPPPPSPSQSNRAPRITDPRTWPAVAHLPVPQFTALLDQTASVLTPSDQFRLARSYVDTNMPCAHRVCLMHPDLSDLGDRAIMARQAAEAIAAAVKRPDDDAAEDEHSEDDHELNAPLARAQLCTCYLATPLTNDQVAAIFGRVEFRALDADLLTEAFHAPHVPKELVFYALMAKLASLQQPVPVAAPAAAPAPAPAAAPVAAPAPAPAPSASLQPSDAAVGVTQDQLHDMIASTLSRVKAAEEAAPRAHDTAPAAEGGAAPQPQQQQAPPQQQQQQQQQVPRPQPIPSPPATPAPAPHPTPAPSQAPLAPSNAAAVEESVSPIAKTLPPPIPVSAPPNAHHAHGAPIPVGHQPPQPVPVAYGAPLPVAHPVPTVDTPAQAMAIPPRSVAGVRPRTASAAPPSARSSMYSDTSAPAAPMQPAQQGQLRPVSYAGGPAPAPQMQPRAVAYPARPPPANGQYGGGPHVAQLMGAVGGDRNSHDSHASFESGNGNKRSSGIGKAFGKIFG
ncbi:hypothetical protein GGF32_000338 [Allomyces javanicus]|nr:hypothetical protein GGF32_000338 [Allomyces javanicus]